MSKRLIAGVLAGAISLTLITPAAVAGERVRLLGERIVPNGLVFDGTTVGGLSGLDRDPRTGAYVLVSDDRSSLQPARFYTADIPVTADGPGPVRFTGTHSFKRPDGSAYPAATVDPEELRVDPWAGTYYWSQEGERSAASTIDTSIREARRDGRYVRDLPIPANQKMTPGAGVRQNYGPEAMTFAAHGALVVSAIEGPLLQDGPEATTKAGAVSRINVQGRIGPLLAQYAYQQEPIYAEPNPPGGFANTGVTSIVPLDASRYLVLERSFVAGVGNKVRIFEIDLRGATDVLGKQTLAGAKYQPVRKKLIADLAAFGLSTVDNVEGMSWGPRLPTGERTLLLVSDNNFQPTQVTQVIALALR